ncbi:MAG: ATP-binding protein [Proteobacteria bacterium]|nr:ATP-binding protein [Pseudomonadota bacterium]
MPKPTSTSVKNILKRSKATSPPSMSKSNAKKTPNETGSHISMRLEQRNTLEKFRRMATVIQDSNDAITFQDLEGNILAWNRGAEQIYGYSEVEALSMNIVDTVPIEYQAEAREFLSSLKRGELVPTLETKRRAKDGRIVDVWLTNTKLTDDKGKLTGIATTERDITERKHAEASLREKAQELEFLREGQMTLSDKMRGEQDVSGLGQSVLSHLAPFLNAQMGAFYYVNEDRMLKRVSGYANTKLDANEKSICIGEGLIGQVALEKNPILLERLPPEYFGKICSALGSSAPTSLLLAPVIYEGEVNAVIELASFSTFSEHQKTFLSHVSENIGIAINTSICRKKQQELLEKSQSLTEELQTQQGELRATNDELGEQSSALQESQTKLKLQQSELEQTNEQLELQTQALEQQRDILKENNKALNLAQTLLEERSNEVQRASQYKSEFLANMSHELRTPLNSSLILAKLLADNAESNLTPKQIQYAHSISSAGNDLLNLINDILDLSKVEAGKLEIRPESVFLPTFFTILAKTFELLAKERNLVFNVRIDPNVPESVITDRQRLEQILKNLLSNAFKFTETGSVMLHVSRASGARLAFAVIDTGIGVHKEHQEVIFEAFRQSDGATNRKYGGTGLGLSISRDLARLLGGSVEVDSIPGDGSRFTLLIPEIYDELNIAAASPKMYSQALAAQKSKVRCNLHYCFLNQTAGKGLTR